VALHNPGVGWRLERTPWEWGDCPVEGCAVCGRDSRVAPVWPTVFMLVPEEGPKPASPREARLVCRRCEYHRPSDRPDPRGELWTDDFLAFWREVRREQELRGTWRTRAGRFPRPGEPRRGLWEDEELVRKLWPGRHGVRRFWATR
jgi:hypothetical protein